MPIRKQEDVEHLKSFQQKLQLCSKDGSINFKITSGTDSMAKEEAVAHEKGEETNVMCLVCKINNAKMLLTNYYSILEKCFGITVSDPSLMICDRCAQLVRTTSEFRELIRDAINQNTIANVNPKTNSSVRQNNEQVEKQNLKDNAIVLPITVTKAASESVQRRGVKPVGKRILTACKYCKHKYPMLVQDVNQLAEAAAFVCARCKHIRPSERPVQCDQCRTVVPARSMYNHLEKHAMATRENLFSRTRLRSLQDPLSRRRQAAHTLEDQQLVQHVKLLRTQQPDKTYNCKVCGKNSATEELFHKHMNVHKYLKTHECQVCGKIFKKQDALSRHYRIHIPIRKL